MNILVVDDAPEFRLLTSGLLARQFECEIVEAENGYEAFRYLKCCEETSLPSLIVLDLEMPIMDGQAFCHQVTKYRHLTEIPIVLCSCSRDLETVAEELAVDGWVPKGAGPLALLKEVLRCIAISTTSREEPVPVALPRNLIIDRFS